MGRTRLIETTIGAQRFIEGICSLGGTVHLAATTRDGLRWVQPPQAGETKIEWHEIPDVVPAVTEAPADRIGATSYTVPLAEAEQLR